MEILKILSQTKSETLPLFDLSADALAKSCDPGRWNIKKILVHLADAEGVLHERIKRVIAEPKQVIWAFEQGLWCSALDYETFPLELSSSLFSANRDSIIYLAGKFYESHGNREFIHSQTGSRMLKDEFDKVALHNQSHLNQIKQALR